MSFFSRVSLIMECKESRGSEMKLNPMLENIFLSLPYLLLIFYTRVLTKTTEMRTDFYVGKCRIYIRV